MHGLTLIASLALSLSSTAPWAPRGATWADFNADGRQDLLLISPEGATRLFLAGDDGQLVRATLNWGLEDLGPVQAAAVADVDGDLLPDLLLSGADGRQQLLRNTGASFEDVTAGSGLASVGSLLNASWVDYDLDERPDLALTAHDGALLLLRNVGDARFERVELDGSTTDLGVARVGAPRVDPAGSEASDDARSDGTPAGRARDPLASSGGGAPGVDSSAAAGTSLGGVNGAPGRGAASAAVVCAPGVVDVAGGACIPASSTPQLGHLMPLNERLFVDPLGKVGVNTLTPGADVHLRGGASAGLRVSSLNILNQFIDSNIEMGDHTFTNGMLLHTDNEAFEIFSRRNSQGGPFSVGPHLTVRRQDETAVGIGTDAPLSTLHVEGTTTLQGETVARRSDFLTTVVLEPERYVGGGARLSLKNPNGLNGLRLDGDISGGGGLLMYRANGGASIQMYGDNGGAAEMRFYKPDNSIGVRIDADFNGDARIITEVLEITGGADLVESFDTGDERCEPGMVLVIDEERPGELKPCAQAYDRRVAGVVSGAGGVQPGLRLGQSGTLEGSTEVALTGRVYVRCNAEGGAIRPGDLLTTSSSVGEAMRVDDPSRAFGAVIGKAMTELDGESGLVLVLVGLQ